MELMELFIRKAIEQDIENLTILNFELFQEDVGQQNSYLHLGWQSNSQKKYFAKLISEENSICYLAEIDCKPIGYLVGIIRNRTNLPSMKFSVLDSMYVQDEHRGLGIGNKLIREFIKWSKDRGVQSISVTAYYANEKAIELFKGFDFVPKYLILELGFE